MGEGSTINLLREAERYFLLSVLQEHGTMARASEVIGISRFALLRRMTRYGVEWTDVDDGKAEEARGAIVPRPDLEGPKDPSIRRKRLDRRATVARLWRDGATLEAIALSTGAYLDTIKADVYLLQKAGVITPRATPELLTDRLREFAGLWEQGLSRPKIAEALGISVKTVQRLAQIMVFRGLVEPRRGIKATKNEDRKARVVSLWIGGCTRNEIKKQTGTSLPTIRAWIEEAKRRGRISKEEEEAGDRLRRESIASRRRERESKKDERHRRMIAAEKDAGLTGNNYGEEMARARAARAGLVFSLREQGYTADEIMEHLGVSRNTVRLDLQRTKKKAVVGSKNKRPLEDQVLGEGKSPPEIHKRYRFAVLILSRQGLTAKEVSRRTGLSIQAIGSIKRSTGLKASLDRSIEDGIIKMWRADKTTVEICQALGLSHRALWERSKKMIAAGKLKDRGRGWSPAIGLSTAERRKLASRIGELREQGLTNSQIAIEVSQDQEVVKRILNKMIASGKVKRRSNRRPQAEIDRLVELWREGVPAKEIAERLGWPNGTVASWIVRLQARGILKPRQARAMVSKIEG